MTNEHDLIEASRAGDSGALDELVRSHQARVYSFAMRMCRNVEAVNSRRSRQVLRRWR